MSENKETNKLPTLVDKGSKVTVTGGFDNDLGLKKNKKVHPLLLPQQKKRLVKFKIENAKSLVTDLQVCLSFIRILSFMSRI